LTIPEQLTQFQLLLCEARSLGLVERDEFKRLNFLLAEQWDGLFSSNPALMALVYLEQKDNNS
jgi:hypothetical protein